MEPQKFRRCIYKRSLMSRLLDWQIFTDVSKDLIASSLKCPYQCTSRHGVISQNTLIFWVTAVSVSADIAVCTLLFIIPLVCLFLVLLNCFYSSNINTTLFVNKQLFSQMELWGTYITYFQIKYFILNRQLEGQWDREGGRGGGGVSENYTGE